jgi:hypothetical protein
MCRPVGLAFAEASAGLSARISRMEAFNLITAFL